MVEIGAKPILWHIMKTYSPGGVFDNQNKIFAKNYENKVPMKRMGNPDDIAPAVSFLLYDDSKYISWQNLIIDGGWKCI
jgi:NAD(P)-dependent dehydrogenase (short-subunit alcohol dehydrogenase family)